jgi:hypothetical protein
MSASGDPRTASVPARALLAATAASTRQARRVELLERKLAEAGLAAARAQAEASEARALAAELQRRNDGLVRRLRSYERIDAVVAFVSLRARELRRRLRATS